MYIKMADPKVNARAHGDLVSVLDTGLDKTRSQFYTTRFSAVPSGYYYDVLDTYTTPDELCRLESWQ